MTTTTATPAHASPRDIVSLQRMWCWVAVLALLLFTSCERCVTCNGSGHSPAHEATCLECDGVGIAGIGASLDCHPCKGTGSIADGNCDYCAGSGIVHTGEECIGCAGRGNVCARCDGSGKPSQLVALSARE